MLMKDSLSVADTNVTIEYDVLFTNGATGGGMVYRGYPLYVNPQGIWWSSENPINFQSPSNFSATGRGSPPIMWMALWMLGHWGST